jgi:hypothetical protein
MLAFTESENSSHNSITIVEYIKEFPLLGTQSRSRLRKMTRNTPSLEITLTLFELM